MSTPYIEIVVSGTTYRISTYSHEAGGALFHGRLLNGPEITEKFRATEGNTPQELTLQIRDDDGFLPTNPWVGSLELTLGAFTWSGKINAFEHDTDGTATITAADDTLAPLQYQIPDEVAHVFTVADVHSDFTDFVVPLVFGGTSANPVLVRGILIDKTNFVWAFCVGEIRAMPTVYKGREATTTGITIYYGTPGQAIFPGFACVKFAADPRNEDGTWPDVYADIMGLKLGAATEEECRNPARILQYLLTTAKTGVNGWGLGIDSGDIDATTFNQAIADCATAGFTVDGGFFTKQRASYYVDQLCRAMRGTLTTDGGKWKLYVDQARSSIQTYDETNMVVLKYGRGAYSNHFNKVRLDYRYHPFTGGYLASETREDATSIAEIGEQEFTGQLPLVADQVTAGKIADYELRRRQYGLERIYFETNVLPSGARPGLVVTVNRPDLGITSREYQIVQVEKREDDFAIEAQSYDAAIFGNDAVGPVTASPGVDIPVSPMNPPATASGLTLSTAVRAEADGTVVAYVDGEFTPPAGKYLGAAVYWGIGASPTTWTSLGMIQGNAFRLEPVKHGETYGFKVIMFNQAGQAPAITGNIVADTDTAALPTPTVASYQGLLCIKVDIAVASWDTRIDHFEIARKKSDGTGEATIDANFRKYAFVDDDTAILQDYTYQYQYRVRAVSRSGLTGAWSAWTTAVSAIQNNTKDITVGSITTDLLTSNQIVGKDIRTATNAGNGTVSGVLMNSTGLAGWNGACRNFFLDALTGTLCATNACLSGTIDATLGAIGGFSIGATALTAGATNSAVGLSSSSGCPAVWAGCVTGNLAPFQVSHAGAVTATSGTLGGWTLGATAISAGNLSLNCAGSITGNFSTGVSGWCIGASGCAEFNNVCARGCFIGEIDTDVIGGFTVDSAEGLYAGSVATRFQMKPTVGLWLGATAFADAPFRVCVDGSTRLSGKHLDWIIPDSCCLGIRFRRADGAYSRAEILATTDGVNGGNLVFRVNPSFGGGPYDCMTLSSSGYLGIRMTPSCPLDVLGNSRFCGTVGVIGASTFCGNATIRGTSILCSDFVCVMGCGTSNTTDGTIILLPAGQSVIGAVGRFQSNSNSTGGQCYFSYIANGMRHVHGGDNLCFSVSNCYVGGQAMSMWQGGFQWLYGTIAAGVTTVSEFMRLTGTGLGIGMSPSCKLDVLGNARICGSLGVYSGNILTNCCVCATGNIVSAGIVYSSGSGCNYFAGNVGIGITNPSASANARVLNIYNSTASSTIVLEGNGSQHLTLGSGNTSSYPPVVVFTTALRFGCQTSKDGAGWCETARFTATGFFGVGNTNPACKLDVCGNSRFCGNAGITGCLGVGVVTPSYMLEVNGTGFFCCHLIALSVGSSNFASGLRGWCITGGTSELNNAVLRGELRSAVFKYDEISAVGGQLLVANAGTLLSCFTTPALGSSGTICLKETTSTPVQRFCVNDVVRVKTFNGTNIFDFWGVVTAYCNRTTYYDYTVTACSGSVGVVIPEGSTIVSYGPVTTGGGVLVNGQGSNSPFIDIFTNTATPWTALTPQVRLGRLDGISGFTGFGLWTNNGYIVGGVVRSNNWCATAGSCFDLTNGCLVLGGSSTPALAFDAATGNLTISGQVTATTGCIAGWCVQATCMCKANSILSSAGFVSFGATPPTTYGNNVGVWLGYDSGAKLSLYATSGTNYLQWNGSVLTIKAANFCLDTNGCITASNATLSGTICSCLGSIGGFCIQSNMLCSTPAAGCAVGMSACTTSDAIAFWAGSSTLASAPFRVTNRGCLTASNAVITGTVCASAGCVGGFSLTTADGLYSGSGATRVQMKAGAGFWAGADAQASAPFFVNQGGCLCSKCGTIGGWSINATCICAVNTKWDSSGNLQGCYAAGTGWCLGADGTFKFGGSSAPKLSWDGTTLSVTGNVTITGGSTTLDSIGDGSTYKRVNANEKTGAGYGYNAITTNGAVYTLKRMDTRSVNSAPSWYLMGTTNELKLSAIIGITGGDTYGSLTTEKPWTDSSGGYAVQTYQDRYGIWERRAPGADVAWGSWYKITDETGTLKNRVIPVVATSPSGSGLYLGCDYMGYYDGSAWKTYMDKTGKFYLTGASGGLAWDGSALTVCGTVCATAGKIGEWTLNDGYLYGGTGLTRAGIDSCARSSISFWAGGETTTTAPFRVTNAGCLFACNAHIIGTVCASAGCFSGTLGAGTVTTSTLTVHACNLVNPFSVTGNIRGWGNIREDGSGSSSYVSYNSTECSLRITNTGNYSVRSQSWAIDPNKIYKLQGKLKKSVSNGLFFVGVSGFTAFDAGYEGTGVAEGTQAFTAYSESRVAWATEINQYFYCGSAPTSYVDFTFYIIGANRSINDVPNHYNGSSPYMKAAAAVRHVAVRFLSWNNTVSTSLDIKDFSVTEVGTGTIVSDNITSGQIIGKDIRTAADAGNGSVSGIRLHSGALEGWNGANKTFCVNASDGAAFFNGTVCSSAGNIGGFTLGSTMLCSTPAAGCSVGMAACTTSGCVAFWAGCSTLTAAPFRVTNLGVLTATSGNVGGWCMSAGGFNKCLSGYWIGLGGWTGDCALGNHFYAGYGSGANLITIGRCLYNASTGAWADEYGIAVNVGSQQVFRVSGTSTGTLCSAVIAGWNFTHQCLYSGNLKLIASGSIQGAFTAGSAGWCIGNDGSAEFNNVTARGTVCSSAGNIGGWGLTTSYISSSKAGGSLTIYSDFSTYCMPMIEAGICVSGTRRWINMGHILWRSAYQPAYGFSINGLGGTCESFAVAHSNAAMTLLDGSAVAADKTFFWIGSSSAFMKFYDGSLTVSGTVCSCSGIIGGFDLGSTSIGSTASPSRAVFLSSCCIAAWGAPYTGLFPAFGAGFVTAGFDTGPTNPRYVAISANDGFVGSCAATAMVRVGTINAGCYAFCTNGIIQVASVSCSSDCNLKTGFQEEYVLERLRSMPILSWNWCSAPTGARNLGPTAQAFGSAFPGFQGDPLSVPSMAPFALRAVQELDGCINEQQQCIDSLAKRICNLEQRLAA